MTEVILESISDGVFTVDAEWRVTSFNRAAEEITGVARAEAIGQRCSEVFRSSMCGADCALRRTLETRKPVIGKSGYIIDADGDRIPVSISTAVLRDGDGRVIGGAETFRDLTELETLRRELEGKFHVGDLSSRSPRMQRVFEILPAVAAGSSTVLVLGETGTGKELVAKTIHSLGSRRRGPFVALNCGALPETLLESELFGHEKGAFTGAVARKIGKFELARFGTVFLDEISEMSINLQAKLLRVLQEMEFERVGGKDRVKVHARIMAATNKDLKLMVKEGKFRDDLYYRLNIVAINLPPLRSRRQDIPHLIDYLLSKINLDLHKKIVGVSGEMMEKFMNYSWPGNIRELENLLVRACVVAKGQVLGVGDFPELGKEDPSIIVPEDQGADVFMPDQPGKFLTLDQIEERYIRKIIKETDKNKGEICETLGISRPTFERKLEKYGITFERE